MSEYNIFRPLNREEKLGLTELGQRDLLNLFLKDLANQQQKYQKKHIPFDTFGARVDFDDKIKNKINEMTTLIDTSKIDSTIDFGDFSEYAKPDRFTYLGQKKVVAEKLVAGIRNEVEIGMRYNFISKVRGNKLSISVPNEDVKAMEDYVNKTYLKESKKDKTTIVEESKEE